MSSSMPTDTSNLPELLRSQGYIVEPTGDIDGVYIVRKNGKEAILDLTSFEETEDSLRTVDATFNSEDEGSEELEELEPLLPQMMNNRVNSTTLPQRVAAIGESSELPVKATLSGHGKTTHASVKVDTTGADLGAHCVNVGTLRVNMAEFLQGDGPFEMSGGLTLVNADEVRQCIAASIS
jgi:hypothetical protein